MIRAFDFAAPGTGKTTAHRINKGEYPAANNREKDFSFMARNSPEEVAATLFKKASRRVHPDGLLFKHLLYPRISIIRCHSIDSGFSCNMMYCISKSPLP